MTDEQTVMLMAAILKASDRSDYEHEHIAGVAWSLARAVKLIEAERHVKEHRDLVRGMNASGVVPPRPLAQGQAPGNRGK